MLRSLAVAFVLFSSLFAFLSVASAGEPADSPTGDANGKQILIIAGPITGHGKQTHEYEKSAVLIKHLLDRSDLADQVNVRVVFDGWPDDESFITSADTIVLISDGGDQNESNHPMYVGKRLKLLEAQMKRGCGLVQLHWSTFNPSRFHDQVTEWVGGYFDYEKGTQKNGWYSAIKHYTQPIRLTEHPVSNGVKPFRVLEEFYYRIRFRENDPRLTKIVWSKPPGESQEYAVGWAVQRKDGGRGFGFTGGHYYSNWWNKDFRKLVLNAVVWSAGVTVPQAGVQTKLNEPVKLLIVTGHNHPAHDWRKTTAALVEVIENDPRIFVDVSESPETIFKSERLKTYDSLVLNYSSWDRQGLSNQAREGLIDFMKAGGGLNIIHFANGSWTDTLPNKESDWPEFRTKIARRIWVHGEGKSGHDAFGNFRVKSTSVKHPITTGLADFNTTDELYYRQTGPLPVEPLLTAKSRDTKQDEPMAWAYGYEKGRVFQTVLGHADVSVKMAGHLMRRGAAWTAGLENLSFDPPLARKTPYLWRGGSSWTPNQSLQKAAAKKAAVPPPNSSPTLVEGKFGKALNAAGGGLFVPPKAVYRDPDITVECWVKLNSKKSFNIIAASETKTSLKHWELYTYQGSGELAVYLPGIFGEIKSDSDICDGKWHFIGMTYSKQFVQLFVDGKKVKSQPINFRKHPETNEGFSIGSLVEKTIGCDGIIDEFRISKGLRNLNSIPEKPLEKDDQTVGYWKFDSVSKKKVIEDLSSQSNHAKIDWVGVKPEIPVQPETATPKKITGHWGEDSIGFRWTEKDSVDNRWAFTKHGRFLASTIPLPHGVAEKGLVIKVGDHEEATVCYDLSRLNMMAAWKGGFLEFDSARFGLIKHLRPVGRFLFSAKPNQQWNQKPLIYHGLYQRDQRQILSYSIGKTKVLESPWLETAGDIKSITREFRIESVSAPLSIPLLFLAEGKIQETSKSSSTLLVLDKGGKSTAIHVTGASTGLRLKFTNNRAVLEIEPSERTRQFKLSISQVPTDKISDFVTLASDSTVFNFEQYLKPGKRIWPQSVTTSGTTGEQTALGFAVDTIRLPFKNPYNSLFFVSGHDWLSTGEMLVSTVHGEVWMARNINRDLQAVSWSRYATGLYQPLGLRIVNDEVFVLCRDQIVKLVDRNHDGEADFHQAFFTDVTTSTGVHDYVCCLETDSDGNFYFIHATDGVVKVSHDGRESTVVATGFRNPNGLGVGRNGIVTAAPQEGNWTPASMVCEVRAGRHYGHRGPQKPTDVVPLGYEKPLVYIPRLIDNSSGGQVWSDGLDWGSLSNQLFHLSYGKCTSQLVLRDEVGSDESVVQYLDESLKPDAIQSAAPADGPLTVQGAIVPLPFVFESGVSRGRPNPRDGHLYLSGLKGWTTAAVRDGSIQRIRRVNSESDPLLPIGYKVFRNGIELTFCDRLDPRKIDSQSALVEAWNYRYSENYGSPEFKISNKNQQGRDNWLVRSAKLNPNGTKLFLEIPEIQLADQVALKLNLNGTSGSRFQSTIYATIKAIRQQTITAGKPFDNRLVKLEERLQKGVLVKNAMITKPTPDLFQSAKFTKASKGLSGVVSISTWIKIESDRCRIWPESGAETSVVFQLTPFSSDMAVNRESKPSKASNNGVELLSAGYYRLDAKIKSDSTMQVRWIWESDQFRPEPIPANAYFFEQQWLESTAAIDAHLETVARNDFLQLRCLQCHSIGEQLSDVFLKENLPHQIAQAAPDLDAVGDRLSASFLKMKILQPDFQGHGGAMPEMFNAEQAKESGAIDDLVTFLSEQTESAERNPIKNESGSPSGDAKIIETGERLYEELGCIACHHLPFDKTPDSYARRSLKYTAAKFTRAGLIDFLQSPQKHYPFRKMGDFSLLEPEAEALASFIRKWSTERIPGTISNGDRSRGERIFKQAGCANCHSMDNRNPVVRPTSLTRMKVLDNGCLNRKEKKNRPEGVPSFSISDQRMNQLKKFLIKLNEKPSRENLVRSLDQPHWLSHQQTLNDLQCGRCHSQADQAALLPEIIYEEGVIGKSPDRLPNIAQVGNKLRNDYLQKLLSGHDRSVSRPWLKARMPSFKGYADRIARGLSHAAGRGSDPPAGPSELNPEIVEAGKRLTMANTGLDCRQCHGVGETPPTGDDKTQIVLGINFAKSTERLLPEFYKRWMFDPLRIDPLTKMPRYSSDGKTTKATEIANGDAEKQFEAIWIYLNSLPSRKPASTLAK